jgi:hypothetical protein
MNENVFLRVVQHGYKAESKAIIPPFDSTHMLPNAPLAIDGIDNLIYNNVRHVGYVPTPQSRKNIT